MYVLEILRFVRFWKSGVRKKIINLESGRL